MIITDSKCAKKSNRRKILCTLSQWPMDQCQIHFLSKFIPFKRVLLQINLNNWTQVVSPMSLIHNFRTLAGSSWQRQILTILSKMQIPAILTIMRMIWNLHRQRDMLIQPVSLAVKCLFLVAWILQIKVAICKHFIRAHLIWIKLRLLANNYKVLQLLLFMINLPLKFPYLLTINGRKSKLRDLVHAIHTLVFLFWTI